MDKITQLHARALNLHNTCHCKDKAKCTCAEMKMIPQEKMQETKTIVEGTNNVEYKTAYSNEKRDAMAKKGEAMPDGSYPIAHSTDLQNAIHAFGRAKDPTAVKAHIQKRAKEMGMEYMLPYDWSIDDPKKKSTTGSDMAMDSSPSYKTLNLAEFKTLEDEVKSLRVVAGLEA